MKTNKNERTTTAITNRAESAIFKGLGVLAESAKSFGFGNKKRKLITKQKALATSSDGKESACPRPTCHSPDRSQSSNKG